MENKIPIYKSFHPMDEIPYDNHIIIKYRYSYSFIAVRIINGNEYGISYKIKDKTYG